MIAGVEIGLLLYGLLALTTGKLMVSGKTVVRGTTARLLGLVLMAPLPLSFLLGLLFGLALWKLEIQLPEDQLRRYCLFIEVGAVVLAMVVVHVVGRRLATPVRSLPEKEAAESGK